VFEVWNRELLTKAAVATTPPSSKPKAEPNTSPERRISIKRVCWVILDDLGECVWVVMGGIVRVEVGGVYIDAANT